MWPQPHIPVRLRAPCGRTRASGAEAVRVDSERRAVYVRRMVPGPTPDELRAAVVDRAVAVTYAVVASELKMARANLNKFLHGSHPQARTLERLHAWYARHYPAGTAFAPLPDAFGRLDSSRSAEIRAEMERRIVRTSRRAVARAVGMSSDGLQKFLDGSVPSSATVEKLLRWYGNGFADSASIIPTAPPARRSVPGSEGAASAT